jgi:Na+(H+)/acetate symporter ActP
MLLTVAALVTNLPSLYYGFVRVAAMPDAEGSAFSVVTGKMIDRGGFSEIVAVIASCSALAAIMSTADSAIIGANNLLTVEWVKNFLWRGASPQQIEYVSKGFTVGFAICALIFSFNVDKIPFAALFNLQVSQNFQAPRVV